MVSLHHGTIIVAVLVHCSVGSSLIHVCACVDMWGNMQKTTPTHVSDSEAT